MRYSFIVVFCSVLFPVSGSAATPRPVDAWADAVFTLARQRSALVRAMVSGSTGRTSSCTSNRHGCCRLALAASRASSPARADIGIRITLSVWLTPSNRVAILGHELQHAIELAHADATDTAALRRLFTSEGAYAVRTDDYFETREAVRVEKRIRRELQAPTQAEPIAQLYHEHLRAGGAKAGPGPAKASRRGEPCRCSTRSRPERTCCRVGAPSGTLRCCAATCR